MFSFIIVLLIGSGRFTTILGEDTRLSVCYVHYRLLLLLYLRESLLMNVIILVDGYFSFFHLHNDLGKYGLISWETGSLLRPGDKPAHFSRDTFINKKRNSFLLVKLLFISLCLSVSPYVTRWIKCDFLDCFLKSTAEILGGDSMYQTFSTFNTWTVCRSYLKS